VHVSVVIFSVCVCYISYSESLFLQQAELMVSNGLRDLGYVQVNIDVSLKDVNEVINFNSTVCARLEHSCHGPQRRLPCVFKLEYCVIYET